MKRLQNSFSGISGLRIALSLTLIMASAILLASGFRRAEDSPWSATDAMEMPIPIAAQALAKVGNTTYSFSGESEGTLTSASYKFDGRSWRAITPYPVPTKSASAVSDGRRYIYIMNGINNASRYQVATYRYDTVNSSYTRMAPNTVATRN